MEKLIDLLVDHVKKMRRNQWGRKLIGVLENFDRISDIFKVFREKKINFTQREMNEKKFLKMMKIIGSEYLDMTPKQTRKLGLIFDKLHLKLIPVY